LLLRTAVESNVTLFRLPNYYTHTLQAFDKCFFGPLKSYFKNEAAALKSFDIAWRALLGLLGVKLLPWVLA